MVTIKDISRKSGFSVTTVSKALNNYSDISFETKQKILNLADEMGYIPNLSARSLVTQKSHTIGIIFEEITGIGLQHPLFSKILEEFKNIVEEHGYDIMFLSNKMGAKNGAYLQHSKRKQVEAVFVLCADFDSLEVNEFFSSSIPSIVIDYNQIDTLNITSNNQQGIELAVNHLIELGHTKIANIHGSLDTFVGNTRYDLFNKSMQNHNIEVIDSFQVSGEYFGKNDGFNAMKQLLDLEDKPTAIFCASDMLAIGAMEAIRKRGYSVPQDFSLIGFDGIDIGQIITPRLTTIAQNTKAMGEMAAINILKMIDEKMKMKIGETIMIETNLLLGETTRRLNE